MSKKIQGWERRLIDYVAECAASPFRPGKLDCALFSAGALEAMTGEHPASDFNYTTIAGGLRVLRSRGFDDHVAYLATLYPELDNPMMAQRGDIAVVPDKNGTPALGVVQGENIYVMTLTGLGVVPLIDAKRVFRV